MTDQKPPAPAAKPVTPQFTGTKPPAPAPVAPGARPPLTPPQAPQPPKPAGAPPLPKPNFSVSNSAAKPQPPTASRPPAPQANQNSTSQPPRQPLPAQPQPQPPRPVGGTPPRPPAPVVTGQRAPQPQSQPAQLPQAPRAPQAQLSPQRPPSPQGPPRAATLPSTNAGDVRPPASTIQQAPPRPLGAPPRPASGIPQAVGPARAGVLPPSKTVIATAPATGGPAIASTTLPKAPTPTPPNAQIPPAKPAEFKKSPLRFLPIIVGILLLLGLGYFIFTKFFATKTPTTTGTTPAKTTTVLTYWGLWEPTPVLQQTLADFEAQNPGIKVNYQQQTYRDYRERLQTAIASGKGPDIFRFHASWVPMLKAELSPMPTTAYTNAEYQTTFFPIATQQLQANNQIVGIPLMYEGLALVYNKEIFRTANVEPPKTWAELGDLATRLTVRDSNNKIQRAGLAIGNAANVDNFSDILGLLMLQNGADPSVPTSEKAIGAVQFYTDFYTKNKVWDSTLPNSTVAFARGDVAMILAPSWRIHEILNQNPNLTIGVAPVPQLSNTKVTWASYWAEGVSAQSKNKEASWKLLKYLSSPEALQKLHSDASKERSFGEIYPRVDMANQLADSPYEAAYLADAPFAQDWYLNSQTHDNGLNDQIIKYYEDAITSVTTGVNDPEKALAVVAQGLLQILRQYNLTK